MNETTIYESNYSNSWALIIGINEYQNASPLGYAVNDAQAIAKLINSSFRFPPENIITLIDDDASKNAIMETYLQFIDTVRNNDRILFFFAGHGITLAGKRGEVGCLVPVDGDPNRLVTLIRWDDLTKNSELIPAKHILYIMDACYGGLAITRALTPGSRRFLKDMHRRYSRQVITAGKADQRVLDSGGPMPGHSVFTGYLIQALKGDASSCDGIITASGVSLYTYERVSRDSNSLQTPHFGWLYGDGDFIFKAEPLEHLPEDKEIDEDILYEVTPDNQHFSQEGQYESVTDAAKEYLSESKARIRLDDLVVEQIRIAQSAIDSEKFSLDSPIVDSDSVSGRLKRYEASTKQLQSLAAVIGYWGESTHRTTLQRLLARMTELPTSQSGQEVWLSMRWYPALLLMYSAGIAATASENFENLSTIFLTKSGTKSIYSGQREIVLDVGEAILGFNRTDAFKVLPGYEKFYTPISEYLFKLLQPVFDDELFLGTSYETQYDRFEIALALVHADLFKQANNRLWSPLGRFAWKYYRTTNANSYSDFVSEARALGTSWPPLRAGLFGGSLSRFEEVALEFEALLSRLQWH